MNLDRAFACTGLTLPSRLTPIPVPSSKVKNLICKKLFREYEFKVSEMWYLGRRYLRWIVTSHQKSLYISEFVMKYCNFWRQLPDTNSNFLQRIKVGFDKTSYLKLKKICPVHYMFFIYPIELVENRQENTIFWQF